MSLLINPVIKSRKTIRVNGLKVDIIFASVLLENLEDMFLRYYMHMYLAVLNLQPHNNVLSVVDYGLKSFKDNFQSEKRR